MTRSHSSSSNKRSVSMADVAQVAGVSQQTVSRVANGAQNVSKATREKVQAAMESMGLGQALRVGR